MNEVAPVAPPPGDKKNDPDPLSARLAEPCLSITEAARALRVSATTLRRYIRDHSAYIDAMRDGRRLTVAVSSIPALAQIRDLRARKLEKGEIDRILASLPGELSVAGLVTEGSSAPAAERDADDTLKALRSDVEKIKRELRDNEVVVRQSLANILFLIEKCNREIQYHVSEERIAANERDLRVSDYETELRQIAREPGRDSRMREKLATLCLRLLGVTASR